MVGYPEWRLGQEILADGSSARPLTNPDGGTTVGQEVAASGQALYEELFVWTKECPTHYALVLLTAMVPQVYLRNWHETLSFNSMEDSPRLPHNLHHHLEGYLWLCYTSLRPTAEADITT
ncbi:hypothetical protein Y1Q_0017659 [Alligator mississippiensis]|uniref:Uncharacterized protein n=1 Tax=Alligator mississippiensis TaxID=8496 RepID=A0A151N173_ALLMI|nr:hypothetical protein Y1Q_0017659 [Alligator mississippiensis]